MIRATKEYRAEIAHRLPGHPGQCKFIHGHSYKFEVTVERFAGTLGEDGMVMDFKHLKEAMEAVIGPWDHSLVLWEEDPLYLFLTQPLNEIYEPNNPKLMDTCQMLMSSLKFNPVPFIPTAENMVVYIMQELAGRLPNGTQVEAVRVWETITSYAEWKRKGWTT